MQGDLGLAGKIIRTYDKRMGKRGPKSRNVSGEPTKIVPIRMTEAERQRYQKAAERAGKSLSEWVRDRLDRAAKRQ